MTCSRTSERKKIVTRDGERERIDGKCNGLNIEHKKWWNQFGKKHSNGKMATLLVLLCAYGELVKL